MFALMVAMDRAGAIGKDGTLPWSLPADLRHFKEYTKGKTVLMGYNTAISIGRALPDRTNLVLSRKHEAPYKGQIHLSGIGDVLHYHMKNGFREIVVCGGAQIYDEMFPYVQKLIVTRVDAEVENADTFFTKLDDIEQGRRWNRSSIVFHRADDRHAHDFTIRTYYHIDYTPNVNAPSC